MQECIEGIFVFLLPVEHERAEFVSRELVLCLLLGPERLKDLDLLLDDVVALLEHLNLGVKLVHFVFVLEDQIFVAVSYLALEVLGAHRQAQVALVEHGLVVAFVLGVELGRANGQVELCTDLVVARVGDLLELLVLQVVPWLQDVALQPSLASARRDQVLQLFLQVSPDLVPESLIQEREEVLQTYDALHVQTEQLGEGVPVLLGPQLLLQIGESLDLGLG